MENEKKMVAVIGMSGIFPEAENIGEFYLNLKEGRDSVRDVLPDRLRYAAYHPYAHYMPVAYCEQIASFDHRFFNISRKEADHMSPEQRLLLQLACTAIEDAGYSLQQFRESNTAVCLGGGQAQDYARLIQEFEPTAITGNMNAVTAGRIAYNLSLNGPAMMIDTSCSSAMVAIYEACNKVLGGEVDYALAGGMYILIKFPDAEEVRAGIGIMAEDGRSRTFSAAASGTGGGEGGGILLLKRLDKALQDNDHICAVIRGGAINHDGSRSAGLTAPSVLAQTQVIRQAWKNADVSPESISYVEAHGTGTKLGDPVEFQALSDAFNALTNKRKFCALGTVKTNIGHLNNAAGLAGVVKCILSLRHKEIFPSLHFDAPNPFIDFENTALYVNTGLRHWENGNGPRRCGVSAFGLSGTNAHLVLEEAPLRPVRNSPENGDFLLKISAQTPGVLTTYIQHVRKHIAQSADPLPDILYSLNTGRDDFECRVAVTGDSRTALLEQLSAIENTTTAPVAENAFVVLLLSGNGMKKEDADNVSDRLPVFKKYLNEIYAYGEGDEITAFAVLYALYQQWQSMDIPAKTLIATGTGRLVKQVVLQELSIAQAIEKLRRGDGVGVQPDTEKFDQAVMNLQRAGVPFFVELGTGGVLYDRLKTVHGPAVHAVPFVDEARAGSLLPSIAALYRSGVPVNWRRLYDEKAFHRVSAPTYPFESSPCWVEIKQPAPVAAATTTDCFYGLDWIQEDISNPGKPAISNRSVLLLAGTEAAGPADILVQQLLKAGNKCIRVDLSDHYLQHSPAHFSVDVSCEDDYVRLEQEVSAVAGRVNEMIHLGNYGPPEACTSANIERQLACGVYSQFFLVKTFRHHLAGKCGLTFVTANGVSAVGGDHLPVPSHNISGALLKGIMAEYPLLNSHLIDVVYEETPGKLAGWILQELSADEQIRFVAYRNDHRYIPCLQQVPLSLNMPATAEIIAGGTYIITGGASGIGFEIAKYVARTAGVHIIILGRTDLQRESGSGTQERMACLEVLEKMGAIVSYHAVDLSNERDMQVVFNTLADQIGKVNGIIHAAGVPGIREPLAAKQAVDFKATLAAKVAGTILLDECTQRFAPDFFIAFSSLNAVVAQKHSADYAVANAFQDAYVTSRNGNTRYMTIAWPGWYETGMSVQNGKHVHRSQNDPLRPLSNREGINGFELALHAQRANLLFAHVDLSAFYVNPYFRIGGTDPGDSGAAVNAAVDNIPATATQTERCIIIIWKEILRADVIGLEDDFFDLGGHSLNGAQVINRLERELGVTIGIDVLFENGTVKELASYIDNLLQQGKTIVYEEMAPIAPREYYDVSHAQRRLWVLCQMKDDQVAYNISNGFVFEGLDREAFSRAFMTLVERHESLRTTFSVVDGELKQYVHALSEMQISLIQTDLRHVDVANRERTARETGAKDARTVFDLEKGPLLKCSLLRMDEDKYVFIFVMHHIISDGWSMEVLQHELLLLYKAYTEGLQNPLPPLKIQYKDYAAWHNRQLSGELYEAHRGYWMDHFAGELPALNLPTDFPRPAVRNFTGDTVRIAWSRELTDRLGQFSQARGASLFMSLQALLKALLYRYTGQPDITTGTVEAGRNHESLENQIGYFVNTLALRTKIEGLQSFDTLLDQVKENTLSAYEHKLYPFDLLVEELQPERDMSRTSLFDVMMSLQNLDIAGSRYREMDAVDISHFNIEITISKFDLTLVFITQEDGLLVHVEYSTDLFEQEWVRRFVRHLEGLTEAVLADSSVAVCKLDYLSDAEKEELQTGFNETAQDFPADKTIQEIFEQQAAAFPDNKAVVFEDRVLTYRELNAAANQLAHHLRATCEISPDDIIGLMVGRSEQMIIGILGILKAGAAWLPIDPELPEDRRAYMLRDAGVKMLLTEMELALSLTGYEGAICALDIELAGLQTSVENPVRACAATNLAYVIYTSGSTGTPKGVMIEHRSNVNMSLDQVRQLGISPRDGVLQFAAFSFDASVYEIFMALYAGATLVMVAKSVIADTDRFVGYLRDKAVTVVTLPPVYLARLNKQELGFLRTVITAGEAANVPDALACSRFLSYYNAYGPTETAVCASLYAVSDKDADRLSIPIGKPIGNTQIHLLDEQGELVPVGVEGEICISGAGLARGYLNQPELTAGRFVYHAGLEKVIYKTGDAGKWLADGNIAFSQRKDNQLKIRGYRIEPAEIVSLLSDHPAVEQAYILPVGGEGADRILTVVVTPDRNNAAVLYNVLQQTDANGKIPDQLHYLPNGLPVWCVNKVEAQVIYKEIFEENVYDHGFSLNPGDVVFDVGANIGLFSLYAGTHYKGARIYAFEPIDAIHRVLEQNTQLHSDIDLTVFRLGLADRDEETVFTYYPNNTALSGQYGDSGSDREIVRTALLNQAAADNQVAEQLEELLEERMRFVKVKGELRRLSAMMRELGIEKIDLLKIDVEKSELDVLHGIDDEDWKKIRQIVIEVHDENGRLDAVRALMEAHGFQVEVRQEDDLKGTGLFNLYASANTGVKAVRPAKVVYNAADSWTRPEALVRSLKELCRASLPAYMVPAVFRVVPVLPLTSHGKVDVDVLLQQHAVMIARQHTDMPPETHMEKQVAGIWEEVLGYAPASRNDNFFERGGHSLRAMQLVSAIHKTIGVRLELGSVFNYPTLEELSALMERSIADHGFKSIPRAAEQEYYPVSYAQQRLWVLDQFEENRTAYNIPVAYTLKGAVDVTAFRKAFNTLAGRYDILRTNFVLADDIPVQQIHSYSADIDYIEIVDLRDLPHPHTIARSLADKEGTIPFNLERGLLFRAKLLLLAENEFVFLLTFHHIITDGWSIELLTNEMIALYNACRDGREALLPETDIQYKDYAVWQQQQTTQWQSAKDYWTTQFRTGVPVLELPMEPGRKRPDVKNNHGNRLLLPLDASERQQLKLISQQYDASLFVTLLTSVYIFLYRYSGQHDIVLGTTVAGRGHHDLERQVGFFINTLALKNQVAATATFTDLLLKVKNNTLEAFTHQDYPFDSLVNDLDLERDVSRSPLFDVLVELINLDIHKKSREEMKGVDLRPLDHEYLVCKYDLSFRFNELEEGLSLSLEYNTDIYSACWIQQMLEHYHRLLEELLSSPSTAVNELPYLSAAEQQQLVYGNNPSPTAYPETGSLPSLFAAQAVATPEAIAFSFEGQALSYRELDERSNQLGHYLREQAGVKKGELVCVLMDRSAHMMVALLGIHKAGAAYVPIDIHYPAERIRYILTDTGSRCLLADDLSLVTQHGLSAAHVITLADLPAVSRCAVSALLPYAGAEELAYVLYTSGSTGVPKGVMVRHGGVVNRLHWMWEAYGFDNTDIILQKTPYVFDVSVWELFMPLCFGARLVMCRHEVIYDPVELAAHCERYGITAIHFVPGMLHVFLQTLTASDQERLRTLRRVIASGEALSSSTVGLWYEYSSAPLYNLYGPTEASIDVTHHHTVTGEEPVPIGRPVANMRLYILDEGCRLAGEGIWGQIGIAGIGLATGYLNQPELSADRFREIEVLPGLRERIYLSGDKGRWLPGGIIAYGGRLDSQVKLRGHRIELKEIESILQQYEGIVTAVAALKEDKAGEAVLIAYIVSDRETDTAALHGYLSQYLPGYMLPSGYVQLERIPFNANGKIDYKALPLPEQIGLDNGDNYTPPSNETEEKLVAIMEEILNRRPIGVTEHFFRIGGNSIKAARLFRRINDIMPGIIKISDLFVHDTVASLAACITAGMEEKSGDAAATDNVRFRKISI